MAPRLVTGSMLRRFSSSLSLPGMAPRHDTRFILRRFSSETQHENNLEKEAERLFNENNHLRETLKELQDAPYTVRRVVSVIGISAIITFGALSAVRRMMQQQH